MSEILARVRGYFVEIEDAAVPARPPLSSRGPVPASVGLVAPPRLAAPAGAALALWLTRASRSSCALLCHWGRLAGGAPAVRSAGRAAAALRARDMPATAAGRLVRVELDEDTSLAAGVVARAAAVVPGPVVIAVGRPRDGGIDRMLTEQDAVAWLAPDGMDGNLLELAAPSLQALGRPVLRCTAPGLLARRVALAGLCPPAARVLASGTTEVEMS
jgi:hypothetical protein